MEASERKEKKQKHPKVEMERPLMVRPLYFYGGNGTLLLHAQAGGQSDRVTEVFRA